MCTYGQPARKLALRCMYNMKRRRSRCHRGHPALKRILPFLRDEIASRAGPGRAAAARERAGEREEEGAGHNWLVSVIHLTFCC